MLVAPHGEQLQVMSDLGTLTARADEPVADQMQPVAAESGIVDALADGLQRDAVMLWQLSDRADPVARRLADRHYNRQHPGSPQFVPPGRCIVLRTALGDAFWVSSWPLAEYVKHEWAGAWICTAFRNESSALSSDLIREAVAATCAYWEPPERGLVTFVDASKTRHKRDPGRCFRRAGFEHVGYTKSGLYALQLLPEMMPSARVPVNAQPGLWMM